MKSEHLIPAFTYELREGLVPRLVTAIQSSGGWVLDRRTTSVTSIELRFEIQLRGVIELYATLAAEGVELTRNGHQTLTVLCTRRNHLRIRTVGEVLCLRLELRFMDDESLESIRSSSATAV